MSGFNDSILGGVQKLIRKAIQSPNYVPGTSGWSINKDGSAEFNSLALRGIFTGVDYVINAAGAFFYSGTPAAGNLIASIASVAGSDGFGNAYLAGVTAYGAAPAGAIAQLANGQLTLQFGSAVLPSTLITTPAQKGVTLSAPTTLAGDVQGTFELQSNVAGNQPVVITNALIKETDPSNPNLIETWHSLAAGNGWTGTVWYRLTPENEVQIYADLASPASAVNGVTIVTLPARYRPASITMKWNATHTGTTNFEEQFSLSTAGALQSTGAGPSAGVVINETIPLDVP